MNDDMMEALQLLHLTGALFICGIFAALPSMIKVLKAGAFEGTSLVKRTIEAGEVYLFVIYRVDLIALQSNKRFDKTAYVSQQEWGRSLNVYEIKDLTKPFCDVLKLHLPDGDINNIAGLEFFSGERLTEIQTELRKAETRVKQGNPVDWLNARKDLTKKQKQNLKSAVEEEYVPDEAHSTALPNMERNRLTIKDLVAVYAEGLKAIRKDQARYKAMKQALNAFPRDDSEYRRQLGLASSSSSAASALASSSAAASALASSSAAASPLASTSAAARKPSKRARIDNDSSELSSPEDDNSASTYSSTSVGNSDDEMSDGQDYSIGLKGKGKGKAEDAGQGQREGKERKAKEVGEKRRRGSKGR